MTKRILFLSDLHVGSRVSLLPPATTLLADDNNHEMTIHQSPYQRWLWHDCWIDMLQRVGNVDAMVLLGDLVDGPNSGEMGAGLWTADMNQQITTAVDLLKMIPAKKIYGCQGSGYHVFNNISCDRLVTERLGGTFKISHFIQAENFIIHALHKQSGSGKGTSRKAHGIITEMQAAIENEDTYGHIDCIARAHKHYSIVMQLKGLWGIGVPSWKGVDRYARTDTLHYAPEHGYVLMAIEDDTVTGLDARRYIPLPEMVRNVETL